MKPARTYKNVQDSPQKGRSTRLHPAENEDKPAKGYLLFSSVAVEVGHAPRTLIGCGNDKRIYPTLKISHVT